jgi:hypothetical protein
LRESGGQNGCRAGENGGESGRDTESAEMAGFGGDFDKNNEEWYNTNIVQLRVF